MADARRIDERIEFSIGSRSAIALVTGGGLMLVLVFALGVMVGRQLARPPSAARPLPAQVNAQDRATEEKEDDTLGFTFHERLVGDRASPLRAAATPPALPSKPAVPSKPAPPAEPAVAKTRPEVVTARAAEPAPEAEPPVPVPSKPDPRAEARADEAAERSSVSDDEPIPSAEAEDVDAAPKPSQETVATPTTPGAPPSPAPADELRWSVQFGAAPNREDASRLLEQLRAKGLPAYIVEVDLPSRGRFFRVRAGRFAEKASAEKLLGEARASGFDGIVMR